MAEPHANFSALQTPTGAESRKVVFNASKDHAQAQDEASVSRAVSLSQLFSFADSVDVVLMAVGTVAAVAAGVSQPIQVILIGDMINSFNPTTPQEPGEFRRSINKVALNFTVVGVAVVFCCFLQVACWSVTASRQTLRIRSAYARAILQKEVGWFDVNEPMQLATRVADAAVVIQEGLGRKLGDGINFAAMGLSGIAIALAKGWELALVLLAFTPVIAFTFALSMKALSSATQAGIESYGKAGAIAQESLSNIRTVHMFNAVEHFVAKYDAALGLSTKAGIKKGLAMGWGTGLMFLSTFCTYACGMFYGTLKIVNDRRDGCTGDNCYDGGRVIIIFFSVIMGALALGQAGPSLEALASARAAAVDIFAVIHRKSLIDPLSSEGKTLDNIEGQIEIDGVSFAYPSRPEVLVCHDYSLSIQPGETVALVGASGSGKSTIVALLERFYDPLSGAVKIDGVDIREFNVKWLRAQIGLVGHEPVLFATTIMENIRHGRPDASDVQVIEAAKMANAFAFIQEFPQGFETQVGERGTQLSGGQKQRIAIARAIIKDPKILLLDEATSALDTESERIVQNSLDSLIGSSRRTTIVVAHRLSTIRQADRIAVHSSGAIVEIGTHDELMREPNGHYRQLVAAQARVTSDDGGKPTAQGASAEPSAVSVGAVSKDHFMKKHDEVEMESSNDEDVGGDVSFLVGGGIGAVFNAAIFPVWGVLLTKFIVLYSEIRPRSDLLTTARYWSLGFVGLGVLFAVSITVQHYGFAVASQRLVRRVRLLTFSAMLRQEVAWFDQPENASGALVSRLATDSATLQAMTSDTLNQALVNVTTLAIGFGITFFYSWEMTLVVLATSPIMLFASVIQAQTLSGTINNKSKNDGDTAAGALLAEAVSSIRTVAAFGMERTLDGTYLRFLAGSKTADARTGLVGGAAFGVAQGMTFFNVAFLFYIGGKWVNDGRITFEDMFMVCMVIFLCMMAVGMATQNMADQSKVRQAARRVFRVIDRVPEIDATSDAGLVLPNVAGAVEFSGVAFAYPSRPDSVVYKNYNLRIEPGQTVALVGASGSDKSTAISLLERFYDPVAGSISLDGTDLRALSLRWLREKISLVSQEPVLFSGTIADNIAMGKPDATRDEVIAAARQANAFEFVSNFPSGLDTDVGDRGVQVSGGQKQRIAIARAILRDPEVLLLDEATSALDNESERVVQESLDRLLASKRRTTIIVAHRLSTIRHADVIAVTQHGAIVELGTHDQLMALSNGLYKSLVARQA